VSEAQIGQRYRKVGGGRGVWEVIAIVSDRGGIRHCRIMDTTDRSIVKLISENTLNNRKFYELAAEA
jgi:hypothetical protein